MQFPPISPIFSLKYRNFHIFKLTNTKNLDTRMKDADTDVGGVVIQPIHIIDIQPNRRFSLRRSSHHFHFVSSRRVEATECRVVQVSAENGEECRLEERRRRRMTGGR